MKKDKQPHVRLTVGIRDDVYEVISRLAVVTEMPKSKVITSLLEDSLPALSQVLAALESARIGKLDVSAFEKILDDGQREIDDVRSSIRGAK